MQPSVGVDRLARGGIVVEVAGEHPRSTDEDLAVAGDAQLDAGQGLAHLADAHVVGRRVRGDGRAFGLAVALAHGHADGPEELEHLGSDGSGARDGDPHPAHPELRPKAAIEQGMTQGSHSAAADPEASPHATPGQAPAPRQPEPVVQALERRGVGHADLDGGQHLLPHARDAEEHSRLHLAQVRDEGFPTLAEVDDVAGVEGVDRRREALGHVAERQIGEHLVVGTAAEGVEEDVAGGHEIGVGEHGALGRTGGARRVHHGRHAVGWQRRSSASPLISVGLGAELLELGERHHHVVVEDAHAARVDDDDLPQRQLLAHGHDLVELLLVLGHEDGGAGVPQEVLDFGGRTRRVDADRRRPDALNAQVGKEPGRPVLAVDRHSIARLHAERSEAQAHVGRSLGVLGPRVLTPDTQVLLAQGHGVRCGRRPLEEQRRQRPRRAQLASPR